MDEIVTALLAVLLIFAVARWITRRKPTSPSTTTTAPALPGVTPAMVHTVSQAFPHIRPGPIVYSLSKTRSAQATSERILEEGWLPEPPASFRIPPSLLPVPAAPITSSSSSPSSSTPSKISAHPSLIDRFGLSARLPVSPAPPSPASSSPSAPSAPAPAAPEAKDEVWAKSREEREQGLRARKERMILAARQDVPFFAWHWAAADGCRKLLDRQAQAQAAGPAI